MSQRAIPIMIHYSTAYSIHKLVHIRSVDNNIIYCLIYKYMSIYKCVSSSVTLTADALPIPGGYIVPERGNVTFTCSSNSGGHLLWKVDFKILGNTTDFETVGDLTNLKSVSSSHKNRDNPASFTVHNIPLKSNGSFVACTSDNSECHATIFVQGKIIPANLSFSNY